MNKCKPNTMQRRPAAQMKKQQTMLKKSPVKKAYPKKGK